MIYPFPLGYIIESSDITALVHHSTGRAMCKVCTCSLLLHVLLSWKQVLMVHGAIQLLEYSFCRLGFACFASLAGFCLALRFQVWHNGAAWYQFYRGSPCQLRTHTAGQSMFCHQD